MKPPSPEALRLVTRVGGARLPSPPWGLRAWTGDAVDVAVWLEAPRDGTLEVDDVAAQLPEAESLPAGATLVVLGTAARAGPSWLGASWLRALGAGRIAVDRAALCGGLLTRGYVDIGAARDSATGADVAWGRVS